MKPKAETCSVCSGRLVVVRGKHPSDDNRLVCPSCLADRMDDIFDIAHPDYGRAFQAESNPVLKGPAPLASANPSDFDPPNPSEPE